MDQTRHPVPRTVLAVDVEKFGDPSRTNLHKTVVHDGLYTALRKAFTDTGVNWDDCHSEDRGDGVFFLFQPDLPKARLVEFLLPRLAAWLLRHNAVCAPEARIRLRVSLHHGDVAFNANAPVGDAVNLPFRLLDAPQVKSALAGSPSLLVIVVSDLFYHEVLRNDPATEPASYQPFEASVKETRATAWMRLSNEVMPSQEQAAAPPSRPLSTEIPSDGDTLLMLAELLGRVPLMRTLDGRRLCVQLLNQLLGHTIEVPEFADVHAHAISITLTLSHHPGALRCLVRALDELQPGSAEVHRVRALIKEMFALELFADADRRALLDLLSGVNLPQLGDCYRLVVGPQGPALPPGKVALLDVLGRLERMNARPDGVPPALAFIEHLASRAGDVLATRLWSWSAEQARRMEIEPELLALRQVITAPTGAQRPHVAKNATLLFRLQQHGLETGRYLLSEWRQIDPTAWSPKRGKDHVGSLVELRRRVLDLISQAEAGWAEPADSITIEFILPRELLNLDVDQWLTPSNEASMPIGVEYSVSLRSLERARDKLKHRLWRRRWSLLRTYLQVGGGPIDKVVHWCALDSVKHLQKLGVTLTQAEDVVALVLASPPSLTSDYGPAEVFVGLNAGVPVMIWHRRDCTNKAFEIAVQDMLADGGLGKLLQNTRLLRGKAFGADDSDSHPGSHVSVMWDDPDRLVEPRPEEVVAP